MHYVLVNEILGRSPYGPVCVGSQAPDSGNAEILWRHGTSEQKERWLRPLVDGEIRSCFSMTEPEVAGSDPRLLRTTAEGEANCASAAIGPVTSAAATRVASFSGAVS